MGTASTPTVIDAAAMFTQQLQQDPFYKLAQGHNASFGAEVNRFKAGFGQKAVTMTVLAQTTTQTKPAAPMQLATPQQDPNWSCATLRNGLNSVPGYCA